MVAVLSLLLDLLNNLLALLKIRLVEVQLPDLVFYAHHLGRRTCLRVVHQHVQCLLEVAPAPLVDLQVLALVILQLLHSGLELSQGHCLRVGILLQLLLLEGSQYFTVFSNCWIEGLILFDQLNSFVQKLLGFSQF